MQRSVLKAWRVYIVSMSAAAVATTAFSSNNSSNNASIVCKQTRWDGSRMPSQQGKVVVVTGANAGIGFEAAKKLAERHAIVVLACRNEALGKQAQRDILEHVRAHNALLSSDEQAQLAPPQVEFMRLDLGSFASIHAFADTFRANFTHIDVLINNAGVAAPATKRTADGIESQFGINHIGHFLLTKLLFDLLEKSPAARIVNISSRAHRRGAIAFTEQGHLVDESGYANSKLANLLFTYELERRMRAKRIDNVIAVAAHPGWALTTIVDKFLDANVPRVFHWFAYAIVKAASVLPVVQTPAMGALPTLYAATAEDVQGMEYYGPEHWERYGYPVREVSSVASYSEELAKKLWTRSEELAKCVFDV